jgi:hypothetical protein
LPAAKTNSTRHANWGKGLNSPKTSATDDFFVEQKKGHDNFVEF